MIQVQAPITLQQLFVAIALPIIATLVAKEISAWLRERRREKREKVELAILLRNYPLHDHPEPAGVLHAENVRYAREG